MRKITQLEMRVENLEKDTEKTAKNMEKKTNKTKKENK